MSFVFETTAGSSAKSAASSRRPAPERWGPMRALAEWLGFTAKGTACAAAVLSDEQKAWVKAKTAMVAVGDGMLSRCRRDHQPLSMVLLDIKDLPKLTSVFGTDVAGHFVSQALSKLNGIATSTGFAARTGATVFTVLLPGFAHERAIAAVHEALGSPCRIEYHAGEHDVVLAPEFAVQTVSRDTVSVAEIYQALRRSISRSRPGDQRRESPLRRERESRTQPAEPQPASGRGSPGRTSQAAYCPTAATIPMPIGPR